MKIIDILEAGYIPTMMKGNIIGGYAINADYGTIRLNMSDGPDIHIAMDKDHSGLDIDFIMHVKFTEDIAASMKISNVAPVSLEDIDNDHMRKIEAIKRRMDRDRRMEREQRGMFFGSQL